LSRHPSSFGVLSYVLTAVHLVCMEVIE